MSIFFTYICILRFLPSCDMTKNLLISVLTSVLMMVSFVTESWAMQTGQIRFFFRFDKTEIDTTYMSNDESVSRLAEYIEGRAHIIESIEIEVTSSPEGSSRRNGWLAAERSRAVTELIMSVSGGRISEDDMQMRISAEDWDGLTEAVKQNYFRHDRRKVIEIMEAEGISDATREWRLNRLDNGYTWKYIQRKFCPPLREACIVRVVLKDLPRLSASGIIPEVAAGKLAVGTIHRTQTEHQSPHDDKNAKADKIERSAKKHHIGFGIKTNMLFDIALTPNIGIVVQLDKKWAIGATWHHAWWSLKASHHYWRVYGGELDIRRYFGKRAEEREFSGHHIGLYAQGFTYDIEAGGRGQISKLSYGGGLEYGYSLPVGRTLNIDFGIGFGYIGGEYKVYEPEDGCYVWQETRGRHFYGPTKAEISLTWNIGAAIRGRKGGVR